VELVSGRGPFPSRESCLKYPSLTPMSLAASPDEKARSRNLSSPKPLHKASLLALWALGFIAVTAACCTERRRDCRMARQRNALRRHLLASQSCAENSPTPTPAIPHPLEDQVDRLR